MSTNSTGSLGWCLTAFSAQQGYIEFVKEIVLDKKFQIYCLDVLFKM